jgi:hypothetical protein
MTENGGPKQPNKHKNVSLVPLCSNGADPSGPIWLLCPFTPKSGREWEPESAAKFTDLSGWQLLGSGGSGMFSVTWPPAERAVGFRRTK